MPPAVYNLFAPEMAKNRPIETRTSRTAYCSKSLLPNSANWTNRLQSISCTSIAECALTMPRLTRFDFSDDRVDQDFVRPVSGLNAIHFVERVLRKRSSHLILKVYASSAARGS